MPDVVIVVDMERGFIEEGNPLYIGESGRKIIAPIQKVLDRELARGSHFIFTQDSHDPDDKEFQMWPPHCIRGTKETEIIPELADYAQKGEIIPKRRYSAFFETNLDQRLKELNPEKVMVVGDCTDICVMHTVADLRNRDYPVEVVAEGVATFDEEAHRFALQHMEKVLGAKIVSLN